MFDEFSTHIAIPACQQGEGEGTVSLNVTLNAIPPHRAERGQTTDMKMVIIDEIIQISKKRLIDINL